MDELSFQMDELFKDPQKTKKFFTDSLKGKTKQFYLRHIIECFFPLEEISAPEFAEKLSGLMKLLLKDEKAIRSEEEFDNHPYPIYDRRYTRYLASHLAKLSNSDSFFD